MNEEEAFIRAIVDSPGDDTPRLVYADWLDDRADPRGPYLRAEHLWASSGKKEKALRALAAPLDAVWVARVSRPPVGICADKIAMSTAREPLVPADLDAVEAQLKLTLPAEYRALLLNWNGAGPAVNVPAQPRRFPYGVTEVEQFLPVVPVGKKPRADHNEVWDLVEATRAMSEARWLNGTDAMADFIPIASGGDFGEYFIGVRGKATGTIGFFYDPTHSAGESDHFGVVAPSLGALFASILKNTPEWYRLARNGDTKGLLAWVDAGGDVNARHPENDERPLSLAMSANDVSLVRELLDRGAKVDRDIRELASWLSGSNKKKIGDMIAAAKPAPPKGKKK